MKEIFCLDCDHMWHGLDSHCPKCGSVNTVNADIDVVPSHFDEDGHFEGSFANWSVDESGE